ncbi:MAG: hypothetical protein V4590_13160 [Bacteroidota bacterium]
MKKIRTLSLHNHLENSPEGEKKLLFLLKNAIQDGIISGRSVAFHPKKHLNDLKKHH